MVVKEESVQSNTELSLEEFKKIVINDYKLACESRQASLLGRKEVLTGKAKFGIFGDGKELAQIAMARYFENGDFRAGYYRDQTFMLAIDQLTIQQFFAQLYAHADVNADPSSAGRQMNAHFATRNLNADGSWKDLTQTKNSSADLSPTASQMPRLLGLAQASKIFRNNKELSVYPHFSDKGNEVAWGTIGDASTSEGIFWETINAAGVLQVPLIISVWDDGYGISVPKKYQTTKESISTVLNGFKKEKGTNGIEILKVKGWDYPNLLKTYEKASEIARNQHVPVLVHVDEITQPQGHSTSGSHERYKTKERLEWALEYDCIQQFKLWIINYKFKGKSMPLATEEELNSIEKEAVKNIREAKKRAWESFINPIKEEIKEIDTLINFIAEKSSQKPFIDRILEKLHSIHLPGRKDTIAAAKRVLRLTRAENVTEKSRLISWLNHAQQDNYIRYNSTLYSESNESALDITEVKPKYDAKAEEVDGRIIIRNNFDTIFKSNPLTMVFGEDSGYLGDVNQGLEGLQEKYGKIRIADTGIREATIIGQGIGLALRGLRPIAEIQYLDYLLYGLQILSDDLATLQYRTKGGQKAPLIIRTRGHRLEGIWHSGSPMGTIINALRGIYICVPRNMTCAAGFYNTLLASDDAGLIIEPLNAYRIKEKLPANLGKYKIPLGIPEVVCKGTDVTIVSYGSTCNLCVQVLQQLKEVNISCEIIDVRTLLPFDINHLVVKSLKKTNKVLFVDEDVPGGATAFMMQKVLEEQNGYNYLDAQPRTLSAKEHRPAYGTDGDYFSKPNAEDIFDAVYAMMNEYNPKKYPSIY